MFKHYKPSTQLNQHMGLIYESNKPIEALDQNKLVGNIYSNTLEDLIFDLKYNYSFVYLTNVKSTQLSGKLINGSIITVFWKYVPEDTMRRIQIIKISIDANSTSDGDDNDEEIHPCQPCSIQ